MPPLLLGRLFLHGLGPVFIGSAQLECTLLLFTGLDLSAALWVLFLYVVRMLAITAMDHRLIAHPSDQAPRLVW